MINPATENGRERFLRAISAFVPAERIAEVHLFPPMIQGGQETGVAVIAAYPAVVAVGAAVSDSDSAPDSEFPLLAEQRDDSGAVNLDAGGAPPKFQDTPVPLAPDHQSRTTAIVSTPDRLIVYRACYRWTRKGPDRGRWEIEVTEEADAPLGAVASVVRGVYRRAGSGSEPERLSPTAFRAAVSDEPWTPGR